MMSTTSSSSSQRRRPSRFSLLLLQHSEVLLSDIAVTYYFVPIPPSASASTSTGTSSSPAAFAPASFPLRLVARPGTDPASSAVRGRVRLGTHSLSFDSDDWRDPIVRIPLDSVDHATATPIGVGIVTGTGTRTDTQYQSFSSRRLRYDDDGNSSFEFIRHAGNSSDGNNQPRPSDERLVNLNNGERLIQHQHQHQQQRHQHQHQYRHQHHKHHHRQQQQHSSNSKSMSIGILSDKVILQRENGVDHPYVDVAARGYHVFTPLYSSCANFLRDVVQLLGITTLQSRQLRAARLKWLVHEREVRVPFDMTALEPDDMGRTTTASSLLDVAAASVHTVAIQPGRLHITRANVYFMPIHAESGSAFAVERIAVDCIRALRALRHGCRDAALELTFASTPTAAKTTTASSMSTTMTERQREVLQRSLSTSSSNISNINTHMLSLSLSSSESSSGSGNGSGSGGGVTSTKSPAIASLMLMFESRAVRQRALQVLLELVADRGRGPGGRGGRGPYVETYDRRGLDQALTKWRNGTMSNYDYLLYLNYAGGRSFNDLSQYPVFPWVLADYKSSQLDLNNEATFRDLSKPVGMLNPSRFEQTFRQRYDELLSLSSSSTSRISSFTKQPQDPPPFFYGTHYSTPAYVIHYVVRAAPAAMLRLQNGRYDSPDRLFHSMAGIWHSVLHNRTDVKELIPEFYTVDYSPGDKSGMLSNSATPGEFLDNVQSLDLGIRQSDGIGVNNVVLPPWANGNAALFVRTMREALESDYVSNHLHLWIDLIFGVKSRNPDAGNVFFTDVALPLSMDDDYEDGLSNQHRRQRRRGRGHMHRNDHERNEVDVDDGNDNEAEDKEELATEAEKERIETMYLEFGRTPQQIFHFAHPPRFGLNRNQNHGKRNANTNHKHGHHTTSGKMDNVHEHLGTRPDINRGTDGAYYTGHDRNDDDVTVGTRSGLKSFGNSNKDNNTTNDDSKDGIYRHRSSSSRAVSAWSSHQASSSTTVTATSVLNSAISSRMAGNPQASIAQKSQQDIDEEEQNEGDEDNNIPQQGQGQGLLGGLRGDGVTHGELDHDEVQVTRVDRRRVHFVLPLSSSSQQQNASGWPLSSATTAAATAMMMTTGGGGGASPRMLDMCLITKASDVEISDGGHYEREDEDDHDNVISAAAAAAASTASSDAAGAENNSNDRAAAAARPTDVVNICTAWSNDYLRVHRVFYYPYHHFNGIRKRTATPRVRTVRSKVISGLTCIAHAGRGVIVYGTRSGSLGLYNVASGRSVLAAQGAHEGDITVLSIVMSSSSATFSDNRSESGNGSDRDDSDHDDMNNEASSHNADAMVDIVSASTDGGLKLWRLDLHAAAAATTTRRARLTLLYDVDAESAVRDACAVRWTKGNNRRTTGNDEEDVVVLLAAVTKERDISVWAVDMSVAEDAQALLVGEEDDPVWRWSSGDGQRKRNHYSHRGMNDEYDDENDDDDEEEDDEDDDDDDDEEGMGERSGSENSGRHGWYRRQLLAWVMMTNTSTTTTTTTTATRSVTSTTSSADIGSNISSNNRKTISRSNNNSHSQSSYNNSNRYSNSDGGGKQQQHKPLLAALFDNDVYVWDRVTDAAAVAGNANANTIATTTTDAQPLVHSYTGMSTHALVPVVTSSNSIGGTSPTDAGTATNGRRKTNKKKMQTQAQATVVVGGAGGQLSEFNMTGVCMHRVVQVQPEQQGGEDTKNNRKKSSNSSAMSVRQMHVCSGGGGGGDDNGGERTRMVVVWDSDDAVYILSSVGAS